MSNLSNGDIPNSRQSAKKNGIANEELLILTIKEAKSVVENLTPNPWPSNYLFRRQYSDLRDCSVL